MNIQESPTYNEIVDLILNRSGNNDTAYVLKLDFILEDGTTINTFKVNTLDIVRDFAKRYSDYLTAVVTMNRMAYTDYIYLGRSKLKARLTMIAADPQSGSESKEQAIAEYTCKLLDHEDSALRSGNSVGTTAKAKSLELKDVAVQLIPAIVEEYRFIRISGIIRATTRSDMLEAIMSHFGTYPVDVHKPDNIEPCKQVIVDVSMNLAQFPYWLQKHGGGVYANDIGWYFHNGWIYTYPLYDAQHVNGRNKIAICVVGPGQLQGVESTYSMDDGNLRILSTGFVESEDTTEYSEYNSGNGVEFNEPNLLGDGIKVTQGVASVTGSKLRQHSLDKRNLNNLATPKAITDNVHYELSRLARNRGVVAHLNWDNANPTMLLPNSEVTLMYDVGGEILTRRGVLLGAELVSHAKEGFDGNGAHTLKAILHVYLEKDAK